MEHLSALYGKAPNGTIGYKGLKQINWLYANIDDGSVDDASRRIVESVSDTTSTMLAKVTADDVKSFQSYTIRRLDQKQSSLTDSEHFKLMNVKEDALIHRIFFLLVYIGGIVENIVSLSLSLISLCASPCTPRKKRKTERKCTNFCL